MFRFRSVKVKLVIFMAVIFLAVVCTISIVTFSRMKDAATKNSEQQILISAEKNSQNIARIIDTHVAEMEFLASTNAVASGDKQAIVAYLERQNQRMPDFEAIMVGGLDGNVIGSKGASGNRKDRKYYQDVLASGQTVLSEPLA